MSHLSTGGHEGHNLVDSIQEVLDGTRNVSEITTTTMNNNSNNNQ